MDSGYVPVHFLHYQSMDFTQCVEWLNGLVRQGHKVVDGRLYLDYMRSPNKLFYWHAIAVLEGVQRIKHTDSFSMEDVPTMKMGSSTSFYSSETTKVPARNTRNLNPLKRLKLI